MNRRFGSISCVTTVAPSPGSPHHTTPWATGFSGQRVRSLEAPVRATAVSRFGDIMLKYFQMNNSVILVLFNANRKIYNINYRDELIFKFNILKLNFSLRIFKFNFLLTEFVFSNII